MAQSFKIKLQKISDEELSELLVNRDLLSGKKLRVLDQEARNRFFANKDFNGENDVYLNPDVADVEVNKKRNVVLSVSIAGTLLIIVIAFIIAFNVNKEKPAELAVAETQKLFDEKSTPAAENNLQNIEPENQNPVVQEQKKDDDASSVSLEKSETLPQSSEKPVMNANGSVIQESSKPKNAQQDSQSASNNKIKNEPDIKVRDDVVENKKPIPSEEQKIDTSKTTINQNLPDTQSGTKSKKNETSNDNTEIQKSKEPSLNEPVKNGSVVSREMKINDLSTEKLRQLVKFQNEWADKQTTFRGVDDYYVDGNVAIKFILTQPFSDSVSQYQLRFAPNLTGKYWKDLEKELGAEFPRTPMQISFVRFDSEL